MNGGPRNIRVLSDSRPGHENQSVGLADALARRVPGAVVEVVRWPAGTGLLKRVELARAGEAVDLLIGAGHGTHLPLLAAARKFGARSVVIMKPSLPTWFFDLCLIPRHDLAEPEADRGRVVATRGALNRIPEAPAVKTDTGVILIGGPSKHHAWDAEPLPAAIAQIVQARPELAWTVGDSRRTPAGFTERLADVGATVVPHGQTQPGWLPKVLQAAREVWVTEDSVSMIFEALTSGARVGVLPMRVKNSSARTVKAVQDLLADGFVRTFEQWRQAPGGWRAVPRLHETGRCAELILKRFF
ncbi:MAG: ELM1/GtrOC1 family putative glycosyltransferase [Verrucomicrobiota bacterium]